MISLKWPDSVDITTTGDSTPIQNHIHVIIFQVDAERTQNCFFFGVVLLK